MGRLTQKERREIERRLHDPTWRVRLQRVQNIIKRELETLAEHAETLLIRTIVPRHQVKELRSVLRKVEKNRSSGRPHYSVGDLEDLVGIKVLCPYPSDAKEVIEWMRGHRGFRLDPESLQAARREKKEGYRGYHFTIQLKEMLLENNEDLMGLNCEVQVKTMLEEAWDAKTHELTYKREEQVHPKLLAEMRKVSNELATLDERTELLKALILERETQERMRKEAVVAVYLNESLPRAKALILQVQGGDELIQGKFTPANVLGLIPVIQQCRRDQGLSKDLCRLAALVGLFAKGRHMDVWALDVCDELIHRSPDDPRSYLTKGSVCWALDRLDDAIELTEIAIEKGEALGDVQVVAEAKGSFAYWVAEKTWIEENAEIDLIHRANAYIDEAIRMRPDDPSYLDTKGFLVIVGGSTEGDVERGRGVLSEAHTRSAGTPYERIATAFYRRHETIALLRLAQGT